jgi:hypothetical protein
MCGICGIVGDTNREHVESMVARIARSYDHFIELVERALEDRDPEARAARQALVRDKTWDVRTEQVSDMIEKALHAE